MITDSRVVLVTGASSGLGKSTAELLSAQGIRVFGTSRKTRGEKIGDFEMIELDVTKGESVDNCIRTVIERAGRIDVLVNNAGQSLVGALEETSVDEAKVLFETNFFGAVRMVDAVLPYMKKQSRGRIINVASVEAFIPTPGRGLYSATKSALAAYSEALRYELKAFGILVSVVFPALFNTAIKDAASLPVRPLPEYDQMRESVLSVHSKELSSGDDPKMVAETVLKITNGKSPKLAYVFGKGKGNVVLKKLLPRLTFESLVRRHYHLDK